MLKRMLHTAQTVLTEPIEAEGTEIELKTVKAPLKELYVYGKSTQETTTGAQLLSFNSNMDVGGNNTFSESVRNIASVIPVKEGDTFYISCSDYSCITSKIIRVAQSEDEPAKGVSYNRENFNKDAVITIKTGMKYLTVICSTSDVDKAKNVCMLNAGDTALPWEPYTGGIPSPNPDYPQEIKSVGSGGNIDVNIAGDREQDVQSLTLSAPNGLPGIPVSSGGNYTDSDGQQWVCDEVDFERGVYVRNIASRTFDGSGNITSNGGIVNGFFRCKVSFPELAYAPSIDSICDKFRKGSGDMERFNVGYRGLYLWIDISRLNGENSTLDDVKIFMNNNPITVYAKREIPVEEPLTTEELTAYKALHSNYPTTIITNSEDAYMKVNCLKILGGV